MIFTKNNHHEQSSSHTRPPSVGSNNVLRHTAFLHLLISYVDAETKKQLRLVSSDICEVTTHWCIFNVSWLHWHQHVARDKTRRFDIKQTIDFIVKLVKRFQFIYGLKIDQDILEDIADEVGQKMLQSLKHLSICGPWRESRTNENRFPNKKVATDYLTKVLRNAPQIEQLHLWRNHDLDLDIRDLTNLRDIKINECIIQQVRIPDSMRGRVTIRYVNRTVGGTFRGPIRPRDHPFYFILLAILSKQLNDLPIDLLMRIDIDSLQLDRCKLNHKLQLKLLPHLKRISLNGLSNVSGAYCTVEFGNGPYDEVRLGLSELMYKMPSNIQIKRFAVIEERNNIDVAHFDVLPLTLDQKLTFQRGWCLPGSFIDFDGIIRPLCRGHNFAIEIQRRAVAHLHFNQQREIIDLGEPQKQELIGHGGYFTGSLPELPRIEKLAWSETREPSFPDDLEDEGREE